MVKNLTPTTSHVQAWKKIRVSCPLFFMFGGEHFGWPALAGFWHSTGREVLAKFTPAQKIRDSGPLFFIFVGTHFGWPALARFWQSTTPY